MGINLKKGVPLLPRLDQSNLSTQFLFQCLSPIPVIPSTAHVVPAIAKKPTISFGSFEEFDAPLEMIHESSQFSAIEEWLAVIIIQFIPKRSPISLLVSESF